MNTAVAQRKNGKTLLILLLIVLMIITYVPALTLWLPHAVYGS